MRKTVRLAAMLVALALYIFPAGCTPSARRTVDEGLPLVRVRLLQNQEQVSIRASQPPLVRTGGETEARTLKLPDQPVTVSLGAAGWRVGGAQLGGGVLTLRPQVDGGVSINGSPYHGAYRFVPVAEGRFDVVNDVNIEDYLKGVLAKEMLRAWDPRAYAAQAIVARTYALYEVKTGPKGRYWDLYPDQRSQVYGGIGAQSDKAIEAVNQTRGIVVAYGPAGRERIFKAYFSACCGGISQSASDAFGDAWSEPLSDQNRGAICAVAPRFNWGPVVVSKAELTRRLRLWGARRGRAEQSAGDIAQVEIQGRNRFGRPVRFVVTDARGARYSLSGEELRTAINTDAGDGATVFSSFFRPMVEGDSVRFVDGHGHGHGVGLCQWCAQVRAEHGQRVEEIVLSFYPASRLVRAY